MKGLGRVTGILQKFGKPLGILLRGIVDHDAALSGKALLQEAQNGLPLPMADDRKHLVMQVGPLMAAFKPAHPQAKLTLDGIDDLHLHIPLGGGGETLHRRNLRAVSGGKLPNEADGVKIITAIFAQAMEQHGGIARSGASSFNFGMSWERM